MRYGDEWPAKPTSTLRVLGSVGEPLNGRSSGTTTISAAGDAVVDTWWQTETGMHIITTMIGEAMKPGFAGKPIPGAVVDVVDRQGNPVPPGTGGFLVIREPWPAMLRTVYRNDERYRTYWETIPGCYTAGDLAVKDKEGYIMILGRADDLIIVAGHIGTAEVRARSSPDAVVEAAVIGSLILKGNVKAFVTLRAGVSPGDGSPPNSPAMSGKPGPVAVPAEIRGPAPEDQRQDHAPGSESRGPASIGDISTLEE